MQKLFQQIDAKMLKESGTLLLLGFTLYMLFKIFTNDLTHIDASLEKIDTTMQAQVKATEGTTKVLEIIERRITK